MCGIVGFSGDLSKKDLDIATKVLIHRGPDDTGVFHSESKQIGLGFTRLSILELSQLGHQPMLSNDNNVILTFNGEIYNFKELRSKLEKKGYNFVGNSDTEVVLKASPSFTSSPK